jgi:hypothetical protein
VRNCYLNFIPHSRSRSRIISHSFSMRLRGLYLCFFANVINITLMCMLLSRRASSNDDNATQGEGSRYFLASNEDVSRMKHTVLRGSDFPDDLPFKHGQVLMTVEDSHHYPVVGERTREYWESLPPPGGGYTVLGNRRRIFSITMFHEVSVTPTPLLDIMLISMFQDALPCNV